MTYFDEKLLPIRITVEKLRTKNFFNTTQDFVIARDMIMECFTKNSYSYNCLNIDEKEEVFKCAMFYKFKNIYEIKCGFFSEKEFVEKYAKKILLNSGDRIFLLDPNPEITNIIGKIYYPNILKNNGFANKSVEYWLNMRKINDFFKKYGFNLSYKMELPSIKWRKFPILLVDICFFSQSCVNKDSLYILEELKRASIFNFTSSTDASFIGIPRFYFEPMFTFLNKIEGGKNNVC